MGTAPKIPTRVLVIDPVVPRLYAEYLTTVDDVEAFRGSLAPWVRVRELSEEEYSRVRELGPTRSDLVIRLLDRSLRECGSALSDLDPETIRRIMACVAEHLRDDPEPPEDASLPNEPPCRC